MPTMPHISQERRTLSNPICPRCRKNQIPRKRLEYLINRGDEELLCGKCYDTIHGRKSASVARPSAGGIATYMGAKESFDKKLDKLLNEVETWLKTFT